MREYARIQRNDPKPPSDKPAKPQNTPRPDRGHDDAEARYDITNSDLTDEFTLL